MDKKPQRADHSNVLKTAENTFSLTVSRLANEKKEARNTTVAFITATENSQFRLRFKGAVLEANDIKFSVKCPVCSDWSAKPLYCDWSAALV